MLIGYLRVSKASDDEARNAATQRGVLEAAGCEEIFEDIGMSGGASNRPGVDGLPATCPPGRHHHRDPLGQVVAGRGRRVGSDRGTGAARRVGAGAGPGHRHGRQRPHRAAYPHHHAGDSAVVPRDDGGAHPRRTGAGVGRGPEGGAPTRVDVPPGGGCAAPARRWRERQLHRQAVWIEVSQPGVSHPGFDAGWWIGQDSDHGYMAASLPSRQDRRQDPTEPV